MEPRRQQVLIALGVGVVLVIVGLATKSWFNLDRFGTELSIGLNSGESCAGGQCQDVNLNTLDANWGLVGLIGFLGGIVSLFVSAYAAYQIVMRREQSFDPKKLAIVHAAAACAALIFLLIKPSGMSMGYSAVVGMLGYAVGAGVIFLAPKILVGGPRPARAPAYGGTGPQPQGGYAPPIQPVQPVQQIQPTMPAQPMTPAGMRRGPTQPMMPAPESAPAPAPHPHGQALPTQPMPMQSPAMMPTQAVHTMPPGPAPALPQPVQRIQPILPTHPGPPPPQPMPMPMPMPTPGAGYPPGMRPPGAMPPGAMPPQPMRPMGPMTPAQPVSASTTIPPGANPCPRCATGMAWSSQYQRWYCMRCQEYVG